MKKILIAFIFICSLGVSNLYGADPAYSIYTALGFGYSPSSIRFSAHDIEAGLLAAGTNGASIGAIKLFRSGSTFAGFGLAFRFTNAIGFHGSVGKSYEWLNWLRFRAELNAEAYTDSFTQANALIGLEFTW